MEVRGLREFYERCFPRDGKNELDAEKKEQG